MRHKSKLSIMLLLMVVLFFQGVLSVSAATTLLNDKEISVDFTSSGELPEGTEVTIYIPEEATYFFNSGDNLFLYYCNQETNLKEFVGEGRCEVEAGTSGRTFVTFDIEQGAEYIITYLV